MDVSFCVDTMLLVRLWLFVYLSSAAPLNPKVDKAAVEADLVIDNRESDEIVKRVDILDDGLHNQHFKNTDRDAKFAIYGGGVSFSGDVSFSHMNNVKVASVIIDDMPQDPNPSEQGVDGGWSNWGKYGECSKECGTGQQVRTRTCTNPVPKHKGRTCEQQNVGDAKEIRECNAQACGLRQEVCASGEINSDSCICKSVNDDESGKECSSNQGCTEEGTCYDVCSPGPYKLQEDCFCIKTNGIGKLCNEGFKCEGGECVRIDIKDENKVSCDFNDKILAPENPTGDQIAPHDTSEIFKWNNNVIPYYYNETANVWATSGDKVLMRTVMDRIQEKTCFTFEEKSQDECKDKYDHCLEINIKDTMCTGGCSGSVSKVNYNSILNLTLSAHITHDNGDDCGYQGLVTHELMHALGVGHSQRRSDRDDVITVSQEFLNSASEATKNQYEKCSECKMYDSIHYDCDSIMHYGTHFEGKEVIVPNDEEKCKLSKLSNQELLRDATIMDYELLNIIGKCPGFEQEAACSYNDGERASTEDMTCPPECLTSPEYPHKYPNSATTTTELSVKDGQAIEIALRHFDVENNSKCDYDYLQFTKVNGESVREKMCGKILPQTFIIPISRALAIFKTDDSVTKKGYKFCYKAPLECLTSPGYPKDYPLNSDTTQKMYVADGYNIEITFHHFDIEEEKTCDYDYLQFFDANSNAFDKKLCGNSKPQKLVIPTSTASFRFYSDYSKTKKGFKFCYKPV